MMTPEQIAYCNTPAGQQWLATPQGQQWLATNYQPQAAAAPPMMGGGMQQPQVQQRSYAAMMRAAPDPTGAEQSLSDDGGKYDGDYRIRLEEVSEVTRTKGGVFSLVFRILESNNDLVRVGTKREHPLFLWAPAALSEAKGLTQSLFEWVTGSTDIWTDQFYTDLVGEKQIAKGLELFLNVSTTTQKRDKSKAFSYHRYERATAGMVLPSAPPTAFAPPAAPPIAMPPGFGQVSVAPAGPPGFPPFAVQAAPAGPPPFMQQAAPAGPPGFAAAPPFAAPAGPPGFPPGLPVTPGASPAPPGWPSDQPWPPRNG